MNRLSNTTLTEVAAAVEKPAYDRSALRSGILHLGLGAFHRAHQAVYTDLALERSGGDWGIVGVSMRSDLVARQLAPQDALYSVLSEDQHGQSLRVVGAIRDVLVAPAAPEALDTLLADPAIRVVTLTITEKGYCLGEDGWSLDRELPQIQRDLEQPDQATTAIGVLARGLARRQQSGHAPLTVISCDNLGENSARLRAALLEYLESTFPEVIPWLKAEVAFPCSMVDRIVPAVTGETIHKQSALLGVRDEGAVTTEPFSQWIIENHGATALPDWAGAGAQFVDDIRPFEEMKLRLLNASHSTIALAGQLAGCETVAEVVSDKALGGFVASLMSEELIPALEAPAGFDLASYRDKLLDRFANPHLNHRCEQIAADSSEKIRQRWLATLKSQGGDSRLLVALACWCYLVLRTDLPLNDPRSAELMNQRNSKTPIKNRLCPVLGSAGIDYPGGWLGEARFRRLVQLVELSDPEVFLRQL